MPPLVRLPRFAPLLCWQLDLHAAGYRLLLQWLCLRAGVVVLAHLEGPSLQGQQQQKVAAEG
jgi:hypothetical protein